MLGLRASPMRWKSLPSPSSLIAAAVIVLAAIVPAPSARADAVDPSLPRTLLVGAPRGAAPSERLDAQRSGRSRTLFPATPLQRWEHHLTGGIELSPVVDEHDNIYVAGTTPDLIKIDPDGRELWRVRFGTSPAVVSPVLTSDGTVVIVTAAGQAVGVTPSGAVRFASVLGVRGRDADTPPLALDDGGVIIAAGGALVEIDRDGAVRARTALEIKPGTADTRVTGALVQGPITEAGSLGALFSTESGSVFAWRPPASPRRLGNLGGFPRRGGVVTGPRTLTAIVDGRRIVDFDLPTGVTHVRFNTGIGAQIDGPVAIGPEGILLAATQSGLLVGVDAAGNESLRVALEKPPLAPPPPLNLPQGQAMGGVNIFGGAVGSGFFGAPVEIKPSPALIVDREGRIAFVRAAGRAGVVSPKGTLALASERVCTSPVAAVPAGDKRLLIACRDGGLWLYGE
jgi:PQQ-like domain